MTQPRCDAPLVGSDWFVFLKVRVTVVCALPVDLCRPKRTSEHLSSRSSDVLGLVS
jgi:hypothetical protein